MRAITVWLANGHTPHDVTAYFYRAGVDVTHGVDPMTQMPRFQWNFLPPMPYVFAAEIHTGLPWQVASKIAPVAGDLATIVLIGFLAGPGFARTARILYAVCPLTVLVSAWHGQVEPVVVAIGLAALLLARRQQAIGAGLALGLAIAGKTWPVVFLPAVLAFLPPRRWPAALSGAAAMLVAWVVVALVALHDSVRAIVHVGTRYRSFAGAWGWSGLFRNLHLSGFGYSGPHVDRVQTVGSILSIVAIGAVLVIFRRRLPAELSLAVIFTLLVVASGFGVQYLDWPVALLLLTRRPISFLYLALASLYAALFYLIPHLQYENAWGMEALSLAIVLTMVAALPWARGPRLLDAGEPVSAYRAR
ncbi:MAG TPA: glycosyltransferase family 87 protein [Acidimicrobiales bacterium]|nr:glycosyltransferase family 87 protein [Acidimicrobiales bacterium]